ncbi:glycosyltransferase family 2 protein [Methanosarcina sp. UBA5]|uniref:glycosyltransferase family 2 protein n=1 Tax=Methanosarcina sp. UBA5 TaxID=1915593 RepID=UPI0025F032DE|nr:glycosyltransferase family 2 protein [Methanosarcina sp. UBA5]
MSDQLLMGNSTEPIINKINKCTISRASKNVTVVLSAYNEETSIGSIILLTRLYADRVIVVDDASLDKTAEIAKKAGAEVIINKTNRGKGASLETGFKAAVHLGADIIVTMDSRGHHNPDDIPRLIDPIITGGADVVHGARYLNSMSEGAPIYRRVGQTILGRFANKKSGKIRDSQITFSAFAASTKDTIHFDAQDLEIESEMLADAGKSGLRMKKVEIGTHYNFEDPVQAPIKYVLGVLKTVVRDIEVNKQLYFYAVPGFALATCGFYMGLKFLEASFLGIESLHFWSIFLMVFLSIAGVYMTVRGIVMHSLIEVAQTETT